jgi:hypothetical protein
MAIVSKLTAAEWAKVKFYYQHDLDASDFTKTQSNATGKEYIYTRDESTYFQANAATTTCYFRTYAVYDVAMENNITADYIAAGWHTLATTGATLTLEAVSGGVYTTIVDAYTPSDDNPFVIEFSEVSSHDWRLTLNYDSGQRPQIGLCYWGLLVELDWCVAAFDPNAEKRQGELQVNDKGFLSTYIERYVEREISLKFGDINETLYTKLKTWHEAIKRNQFFVAWNIDAYPEDVFIMRSKKGRLNAPFNIAARRGTTINLVGKV